MTNEEVKKGLDCTARITGNELIKSALNIITVQEEEIDALKAEFKQLETNADILARGVRDLYQEKYELSEQLKEKLRRTKNERRTKKSNII